MAMPPNRRTFLSAAAGAIAAAPLLAAAKTPPRPRRCRGHRWTRRRPHPQARRNARAKLVAICDDYPPHLAYGQRHAGEGV